MQFTPEELAEIQAQQQQRAQPPLPQTVPPAAPTMPQAQPWPGGGPATAQRKRRTEQTRAEQVIGIAGAGEGRETTKFPIELQTMEERLKKLRLDNEKLQAQIAAGDVGAKEDEARSASHVANIDLNLKMIDHMVEKFPDAAQPGFKETFAGMFGEVPKGLSQSGPRQIIDQSYKPILESTLWLMTGAAYNAEQLTNMSLSMVPQWTDKPEALQFKRLRVEGVLQQARIRAGVANKKAQEAINEMDKHLDMLYPGTKPASEAERFEMGQSIAESMGLEPIAGTSQRGEQSGTEDTIPVTGIEQAIYEDRLGQIGRGNLTVDKYIELRKELNQKFGPEGQQDIPYDRTEAENFVKSFNEGNASLKLPPYRKQLSGLEKVTAGIQKDYPGVSTGVRSYANAMTAGIPMLAAGDEARDRVKLMNDENFWWSLGGDVAGSVAPTGLLTKGAGKLFGRTLADSPRAVDDIVGNMLYGGTRGYNEDTGAGWGAGLGGAGALGGRVLTRGFRGSGQSELAKHTEALQPSDPLRLGIKPRPKGEFDPTTMQRMGLGKIEEIVQGLPGVRGAREKSLQSWNYKNIQDVLDPFGIKLPDDIASTQDANLFMHKVLDNKYNELRPRMGGVFDKKFQRATEPLYAEIRKTAKTREEFWPRIQEVVDLFKGNEYTGETFKDADQALRAIREDWMDTALNPNSAVTNKSQYQNMARVVEKLRQQLRAQVARDTPDVASELKKLDRAWSQKVVLEDASKRTAAAKVNKGLYGPGDKLQSLAKFDNSIRGGAFARGVVPGQKQTQIAADFLGSKSVPETASWFQTGALTGAAGLATGGGALLNPGITAIVSGTAGGMYAPIVKRVLQAVAAGKRPSAFDVKVLGYPVAEAMDTAMAQSLRRYGQEGE